MAEPIVQSVASDNEASNVTSHSVTLPATIAADDFIVIYFDHDGGATTTPPSGFTEILELSNIAVFVKKADGTEGGTSVTVTTSASEQSAWIVHAGDAWSEDIAGIEVSTGATGSSVNPNSDSLTHTGGVADYLWISFAGAGRGDRTVSSFPTGYADNQLAELNGNGAAGAAAYIATRGDLNTATEDPGAYTLGGSTGWTAATIAISPAGAPAGGRIMSSLAGAGGLAGQGGIAGQGGGLAG